MRKQQRIQDTLGDKLFLGGVYLFLTSVLIVILYPLIFIVSSSFSSPGAVISGRVWLLPVEPSLIGYRAVFANSDILTGFYNSGFYMVFGTMINLAMTTMLAYPLARHSFYGRNVLMVLLVFTMMFSGGLIPTYLTVKGLGLLDTRWAMMIPSALAVWQVIIARTFFQVTIPRDLEEAAEIDGCGDINFMLKIVLPLSKPILAVLTLMYAVFHWNTYFDALIYLSSKNLLPLQIKIREILILNRVDQGMMVNVTELGRMLGLKNLIQFALIVVSSVPVLLIYPFVQKYFVKGIMIGSLKG